MFRHQVINKFIKQYGYKTYLEIGVLDGANLALINLPSENKDGVDPTPKSPLVNYPISSDDFFTLYPNKFYDLIFIDGLHIYQQVYRDIQNSVNKLNPKGKIVLHDCNPCNSRQGSEKFVGGAWMGTVWKAVLRTRIEYSYDFYTVNTDCGCGILDPFGESKPVSWDVEAHPCTIKDLSYEFFDKFRNQILNLVSIKQFEEKLLCTQAQ